MNRLLALVAVASLGTGCVVDDTCDVRIQWDDFEAANGTFQSCGEAGVTSVDVWVDGRLRATAPCGSHFADLTVSGGYHFWTVEGVDDATGRIVNRHAFELDDSCGLAAIVTRPAQGSVDLRYAFFSGGTPITPQVCTPGSFLWLSIFDWIAGDLAVLSDADFFPEAFTCGGPFILNLPAGDYTLDWMEESGPAPSYTLEAADCRDRDFLVFPGDDTAVPVDLDRDVGPADECARRAALRSDDAAGRASTPRRPSQGAAPVLKASAP